MTAAGRLEELLGRIAPAAMCDDCIAAKLKFPQRQQSNILTRKLSERPGYRRYTDMCSACRSTKLVICSRLPRVPVSYPDLAPAKTILPEPVQSSTSSAGPENAPVPAGLSSVGQIIRSFLDDKGFVAEGVDNERTLQLELAIHLRGQGLRVQFEKDIAVRSHTDQTKRQKRYLDLFVVHAGRRTAVELKTPLAGRVPETLYDVCADIAFVEAIIRDGKADDGICLLLTSNSQYWRGAKSDGIYATFRGDGTNLSGSISKPTGARDHCVYLAGSYRPEWQDLGNTNLLPGGRYCLFSVGPL